MTLKRYTGNTQTNVNQDAKSPVTAKGEIRLTYRVDSRTKELLTTSDHPTLAGHVNLVKLELAGTAGGAFYLNEFGDVLVPDGVGGTYWAGHYEETLLFAFAGTELGPVAPDHLRPRDRWDGPHVGIRYVLRAGGDDIRFESKDGPRTTQVYLSDHVGKAAARETAARVAVVKGANGGRFYINERRELFAPTAENDYEHFVYIGHLDDSPWFNPPDGFDRA